MPDPRNDPNRDHLLRLVEQRAQIDHFVNIRRLGADGGGGWFSLVFEATDKRTGEEVILKVYHPMERSDPYRWACFQRESTILHSLAGQQDIVQCISPQSEFIEHVQTPIGPWAIPFAYVVLQKAQSDVGQEILASPIHPRRSLHIFRAMARGIQRAHARRIAHRDIKPANFLTRCDGSVLLSDFGTARDLSQSSALPRYDAWPGDTLYTAPEILAGLHDQDPELAFGADFFALGATLFELFTRMPLAVHAYGQNYFATIWALNAADPKDRSRLLVKLLPTITATQHLPSVSQFGIAIPGSIAGRIDRLYQSLAAFDYRHRQHDFVQVFRQVDICVLTLDNQAKYDIWNSARKRRAQARRALTSQKTVTP